MARSHVVGQVFTVSDQWPVAFVHRSAIRKTNCCCRAETLGSIEVGQRFCGSILDAR